MLVLSAGFYAFRHRKQFFGYRASEGDTYASANLRMWLVILVWIHAVVITALMIFEVDGAARARAPARNRNRFSRKFPSTSMSASLRPLFLHSPAS